MTRPGRATSDPVASDPATCGVHRWGRSPITRAITTGLLGTVVCLGLYLLARGAAHVAGAVPGSAGALRPSPEAASLLANYFWLASICFGFIGTLRFSVYKEVTSCPVCARVGDPPFYRDPATAFHRYITMVIVSTLCAFCAVLVTFVP